MDLLYIIYSQEAQNPYEVCVIVLLKKPSELPEVKSR